MGETRIGSGTSLEDVKAILDTIKGDERATYKPGGAIVLYNGGQNSSEIDSALFRNIASSPDGTDLDGAVFGQHLAKQALFDWIETRYGHVGDAVKIADELLFSDTYGDPLCDAEGLPDDIGDRLERALSGLEAKRQASGSGQAPQPAGIGALGPNEDNIGPWRPSISDEHGRIDADAFMEHAEIGDDAGNQVQIANDDDPVDDKGVRRNDDAVGLDDEDDDDVIADLKTPFGPIDADDDEYSEPNLVELDGDELDAELERLEATYDPSRWDVGGSGRKDEAERPVSHRKPLSSAPPPVPSSATQPSQSDLASNVRSMNGLVDGVKSQHRDLLAKRNERKQRKGRAQIATRPANDRMKAQRAHQRRVSAEQFRRNHVDHYIGRVMNGGGKEAGFPTFGDVLKLARAKNAENKAGDMYGGVGLSGIRRESAEQAMKDALMTSDEDLGPMSNDRLRDILVNALADHLSDAEM